MQAGIWPRAHAGLVDSLHATNSDANEVLSMADNIARSDFFGGSVGFSVISIPKQGVACAPTLEKRWGTSRGF